MEAQETFDSEVCWGYCSVGAGFILVQAYVWVQISPAIVTRAGSGLDPTQGFFGDPNLPCPVFGGPEGAPRLTERT